MTASDTPMQHLLDECKTVEENCLYTAQAHFEMADRANLRSRYWLIIPSCVSALAGMLTAIGLPGWIGAFAAVSGLVTAITSALGIFLKAEPHKVGGNMLTALRHEARALRETYSLEFSRELFVAEVRRINDRYNHLIQVLETTDQAAFEAARTRIKSGCFETDFRAEKNGKR